MGNWIISPSEGVRNNNDGSFTLPCSNTDVVYNITYVNDEGCSSNTVTYTYVTSGECGTCTDFMGNLSITASTLPAESASSMSFGEATLTDEYTAYTFSSSNTSMINNIGLGGNVGPNTYWITGTVYENTSSYGRSSTITVNAKGPNLPSTGCNDTFTLGQEAGGGGGSCPTDSEVYSLYDIEVSSLGEDNVELGCTLNNSNFTSYTFSDAGYTAMTNVGYNGTYDNDYPIFAADFKPNDTTNERTFTIFLTGITNDGQKCNYNFNVKQKGASPCTCDDFSPTSPITVSYSGGTYALGATICSSDFSIDTTNANGIISTTGVTEGKVRITCNANSTGAAKTGSCVVSYTAGDSSCSKTVNLEQEQGPITIKLSIGGNMSGKYSDQVQLFYTGGSGGIDQLITYPKTAGTFTNKSIAINPPYKLGTINSVIVIDTAVSHMPVGTATLTSTSDTEFKDGANIKINIT